MIEQKLDSLFKEYLENNKHKYDKCNFQPIIIRSILSINAAEKAKENLQEFEKNVKFLINDMYKTLVKKYTNCVCYFKRDNGTFFKPVNDLDGNIIGYELRLFGKGIPTKETQEQIDKIK